MKKILYFFGLLLFLASCAKTDTGSTPHSDTDTVAPPPPPPPSATDCRVKQYIDIVYTYDTLGRLYQLTSNKGVIEFTYSGQSVTVTDRTTNPYIIQTATVNKHGYITYWDNKYDSTITTATYTNDGYVTEIITKKYDGTLVAKDEFTVKDGNVVARTESAFLGSQSQVIHYSLEYDLETENIGKVLYYNYEGFPMEYLFHKPTKNLLIKESESALSALYTFKYDKDARGLPFRMQVLKNGLHMIWRLYNFDCK